MILGNKNDMEEKRVVSRERGEAVSVVAVNAYGIIPLTSVCADFYSHSHVPLYAHKRN
jgi:hypothetical protein